MYSVVSGLLQRVTAEPLERSGYWREDAVCRSPWEVAHPKADDPVADPLWDERGLAVNSTTGSELDGN